MSVLSEMATCRWTSFSLPSTLVTVGLDDLAMLYENVIYFLNLKTKASSYYMTDSIDSAGASCLAGHASLRMFAYSEAILMPSIHVLRYPSMSTMHVFETDDVANYIDIIFSQADLLVALSGYPDYKIRVWNYRTGEFLVETDTGIKSSAFSLLCSNRNIPMIVQYSIWNKSLHFWELQYTSDSTYLHEVSSLIFPQDKILSVRFGMCFAGEDDLYVVNDYGVVFVVQVAQFHLKREWGSKYLFHGEPQEHSLYALKQGLMIVNNQSITYIVKRRDVWNVDWVLQSPPRSMVKMICTFTGDVYATDKLSRLYVLTVERHIGKLNKFVADKYTVVDYTSLRGVREENLLVLTTENNLRLVEIGHHNLISSLIIPEANCVTAHNSGPYAAAGTKLGQVYFISFEKSFNPEILHVMHFDPYPMKDICLRDTFALIRDTQNGYKKLLTDFKERRFFVITPQHSYTDMYIMAVFLISEDYAISFAARDMNDSIKCATEMLCSHFMNRRGKVRRRIIALPKKYRDIVMLQFTDRDAIEFAAIPNDSCDFDILLLRNVRELVLLSTLRTLHMGYALGISGTKNLVTFGVASIFIHFRSHPRSPKPYLITRRLHVSISHRLIKRVEEVYNNRYLMIFLVTGCIQIYRLPSLLDNLHENIDVSETDLPPIAPHHIVTMPIYRANIVKNITKEDYDLRAMINAKMESLVQDLRALIDYDISVTGKTAGIYRKFCLHQVWLDQLNEQARKLCALERNSLVKSIDDQARIRNWIMQLISGQTQKIGVKLRAIFAGIFFECYSIAKPSKDLIALYNLHRFNDLQLPEDEQTELDEEANEIDGTEASHSKLVKVYLVRPGIGVYDHVMSDEFQMQDPSIVTTNQIITEDVMVKILLDGPLKLEFNKRFDEVQQAKQEVISSVLGINSSLVKIHDDMNCMLELLRLETFNPKPLDVPTLMNDEVLERIMTVDDSEIKAINRRKKKDVVADQKRGRMLLWALDFWVRALNTMMDGVLEKLWEEEIKKTPPEPEFMSKREPHEYTLEDQKLLRIYQDTLLALERDRRKYLSILNVKEVATLELKRNTIMKFNERCSQMAVLKLKYDYALRHKRVRLLGMQVNFYERLARRESIDNLNDELEKTDEYIEGYTQLIESWQNSVADVKHELDLLNNRDRHLDRQFKSVFLTTIPGSFGHELLKLYRRRPKIVQKTFQSTLVCQEIAARVLQKGHSLFPLPSEVVEYFSSLEALDDPKSGPNQLDPKHWDSFVKQRRQKIESEFKIKGVGYQLADSQERLTNFIKDLVNLQDTKQLLTERIETKSEQYFSLVTNQRLQITLPLGQVEVTLGVSMNSLKSCILMHIDDINAVNDLIKEAGAKKLQTMERLAEFRRKVLYTEWEHRMHRANIEYLKYMVQVIEKCKVSIEFLQLLRNWKRVKANRPKMLAVGVIENKIEERIAAFRKNLDRVLEKIEAVKEKIKDMRNKNQKINRYIDETKVDVTLLTTFRDTMLEENQVRDRAERMRKIKQHCHLLNEVRQDYVHILELKTILELQRLRTFPTLGPLPNECPEVEITREI